MAPPVPPAKVVLYQKNAQIFEIDGLKGNDGAYLNAASVSMSLVDQNGAVVNGINNVVMSYVAASNGIYQGIIPGTFDPPTGQGYQLIVDSIQGAAVAHWQFSVEVDIRRS